MNRVHKTFMTYLGLPLFLAWCLTSTVIGADNDNRVSSQWGPQGKKFGLGILIGEPTGISWKAWTTGSTAIDGGLAWSLGRTGALHLHIDHLWHDFGLIKTDANRLPFFYGIGGRAIFAGSGQVGVRVPVGLSYIFDSAPVDLSFELAPVVNLVPSTALDVEGGLAVRFYF